MSDAPHTPPWVFDELRQVAPVDKRIVTSVLGTMSRTIPSRLLAKPLAYFVKTSLIENKEKLEIAVLTSDYVMHDFTFALDRRTTTAFTVQRDTEIVLRLHYSTPQDEPAPTTDSGPYRADLAISNSPNSGVAYSVEGDRRAVEALVTFADKCILAIHSLPSAE